MHPIEQQLRRYASAERKAANERFFKTGPGEYGEGDVFIGARMPDLRRVAGGFSDASLADLRKALYSPIHEVRLAVLIILVNKTKKMQKGDGSGGHKRIVDFYLQHRDQVNNWDLVDVSAHYILGQYILDNPAERTILDELILSENMWHRRIAMVSTWIMNRAGQTDETLRLAERLLDDPEDLMHKATGWMLREAWKRDPERVERFLQYFYPRIPRTTLRYAIERMPEGERQRYLKGMF